MGLFGILAPQLSGIYMGRDSLGLFGILAPQLSGIHGAGPLRDELGMEGEEEGSFLGQTAELDCTVDDLDASVEWGMSSLELRAMGNNR